MLGAELERPLLIFVTVSNGQLADHGEQLLTGISIDGIGLPESSPWRLPAFAAKRSHKFAFLLSPRPPNPTSFPVPPRHFSRLNASSNTR
jgi:hypothetical protein